MELSDLRVFVAVAEAGGISRAATGLHAVQSSVSARIAGLEKELGVVLLRRHARGVALTSVGERFVGYARRITSLADEAARSVRDDLPGGPLRLGAMETTVALRLPGVLAGFTAALPEVDLTVVTGPSDVLVAAVRDHALDAALVAGPVGDPDLDEEPVLDEELVLVGPRALGGPAELLVSPVAARMIVFRAGCTYRRRLEAFLRGRGVAPQKVLEYGSLEAILACVAAGLGVTMLPAAVVADVGRREALRTHALPAADARAPTVLVRRHDVHPTAALGEFRRHLLDRHDPASEPAGRAG